MFIFEAVKLFTSVVSHILLSVRATFDPWNLVPFLRLSSCASSLILLTYCYRCRRLITAAHAGLNEGLQHSEALRRDAVFVAFCVVLYPINFFYFPLYYTDTLSTTSIVVMYYYTLRYAPRTDSSGPSVFDSVRLTVVCSGSVLMRQTNVIWVCFCLGISIIEVLLTHGVIKSRDNILGALHGVFFRYPGRSLHVLFVNGTRLLTAEVEPSRGPGQGKSGGQPDPLATGLIYPFLLPILGFLLFIKLGNEGSIVLGDKSHHVATLHPANLCHCLTVLAAVIFCIEDCCGLYYICSARAPAAVADQDQPSKRPLLPRQWMRWTTGMLVSALALQPAIYAALLSSALQPHPFLLADNRHYMFYLWKRLLSIDPWSFSDYSNRFADIASATSHHWISRLGAEAQFVISTLPHQKKLMALAVLYATALSYLGHKCTKMYAGTDGFQRGRQGLLWVLIYLVAVCITILPVPLIELRYYSPAVVVGILNCGTLLTWWNTSTSTNVNVNGGGNSGVGEPKASITGAALFLVVCTTINAATMYIFLYRPFVQPTGTATESEMARFMF